MASTVTTSPSSASIVLLLMVFLVFVHTTRADYTFALSEFCQPSCQRSHTCIKQTRNCTESTCPSVVYCVNIRHLPRRYRHAIRALLATPPPRPGCPNRLLYSPCISQCRDDSGCRPGHLCCFNGCGRVCVPDLRQPYQPKSGFCPKSSWMVNPTCQSDCHNDYECRGHRKCCRTSCGNKCSHPCFFWLTENGTWRLPPGCTAPAR